MNYTDTSSKHVASSYIYISPKNRLKIHLFTFTFFRRQAEFFASASATTVAEALNLVTVLCKYLHASKMATFVLEAEQNAVQIIC